MPFHFPLEAVLHFRQSVEHQQELRLRAANQQVARGRHLLEQLDARITDTRSEQARQLSTGTTAAELRFGLLCEASLQRQSQELLRELLRVENLRDQQQKIFQQARRERETFESLRDRQLEQYRRDAARREQRQLDDLFLQRQAYLRREARRQTDLRPTDPRHG
jgi:flagellar export protein FliJ